MTNLRQAFGRMLERYIRSRLTTLEVGKQLSPAVIFAPHPDDETLGCGGIAHKMLALGARIEFVFLTDGATSHANHVPAEVLRDMREREALQAVGILGAGPSHVTFLGYPDGKAMERLSNISQTVVDFLQRWRPHCVFIPCAKDLTADHIATNIAVRTALGIYGRKVTVFEYPVWYWYHWPWVSLAADAPHMRLNAVRQTFITAAGMRALSAFNTKVYVGDVIATKRSALESHITQVRRPPEHPDWAILSDISKGDFLNRLLNEYEFFNRYELNG